MNYFDSTQITKHPADVIDVLTELQKRHGATVEACGSRVTCSPAPTDSDYDYLVELPAHKEQVVTDVVSLLSYQQFHWEGSEHYQDAAGNNFMSWRRDDVNIIVTANPDFARRHRAATAVCCRLNLMEKADRIALFQAVLYGNAEVRA